MRLIASMQIVGGMFSDEVLVSVELTDKVLFALERAQKAVIELQDAGVRLPRVEFSIDYNEAWEYPTSPMDWNELHPEGYIIRRRTTYTHLKNKKWGDGYECIAVWHDGVYLKFFEEYGGEWESQWIPMEDLILKRKVLHA